MARSSTRQMQFADRYELGALIGEGGMGVVYRVLDRQTGDTRALKVLHEWLDGDQALIRFKREYRATSRLLPRPFRGRVSSVARWAPLRARAARFTEPLSLAARGALDVANGRVPRGLGKLEAACRIAQARGFDGELVDVLALAKVILPAPLAEPYERRHADLLRRLATVS